MRPHRCFVLLYRLLAATLLNKNTGAKDGGVEQQTASSIPSYLSTVRIQNRFT